MSDSNKKILKWQAGNALQPIKMALDGIDIPMETGMLYYDNIVQSFEDTIVHLASLDNAALEKAVAEFTKEKIDKGLSFGETNHPDSIDVNYERACIKVDSFTKE